jgi:hypothetical protein
MNNQNIVETNTTGNVIESVANVVNNSHQAVGHLKETVFVNIVESTDDIGKIPDIIETIPDVIKTLILDKKFMEELNIGITNIMADGKIDKHDVIELVFLILSCYNNFSKFRASEELLPELIDDLVMYILKKEDLIQPGEEENIRRMLDSAIKLAALKPKFEKCIKKLKLKLSSCF